MLKKTKAKKDFDKSVIKHSKEDIETLLALKLDIAGPLLALVTNGIDNMGGVCYGYKKNNSRIRSVRFMTDKMKLSENLASFLYLSMRCGIVHQGMAKIGYFFVENYRLEKGKIFYKDINVVYPDGVYLNVTELAYLYINTINMIASDPDKNVNCSPFHLIEKDEDLNKAYNEARDEITNDIRSLNLRTGHPMS